MFYFVFFCFNWFFLNGESNSFQINRINPFPLFRQFDTLLFASAPLKKTGQNQ